MKARIQDAFQAAGLNVTEHLTLINYGNRGANLSIEYLVVHYVGAVGNARENANYYHDVYRGASAHYFVDFDGSIIQVVADGDVAWHCGTKYKYRHPHCRNVNSIGIEMCVRNRRGNVRGTDGRAGWYFEPATIDAAQRLLRVLMEYYDIPIKNVLRHYDVTGKICPAPYCNGQLDWGKFKAGIRAAVKREGGEPTMTDVEFEGLMERYLQNQTALDGSNWSQRARRWAESSKLVQGDATGHIGWRRFVTLEQLMVVLQRSNAKKTPCNWLKGKR